METIFERNTFQRAATPCLQDAALLLDELKCEWWCEAGTCLGITRDKDFIAHDSDIDIGLTDWSRAKEISDAFEKAGFFKGQTFGTPENGLEIAFAKHGVKIDLFFFYVEGDKMWHSAWQAEKQLFLDFPTSSILPLRRQEFQGFEINMPYDARNYLECRYGDWETIKTDWNWSSDPLCLRK